MVFIAITIRHLGSTIAALQDMLIQLSVGQWKKKLKKTRRFTKNAYTKPIHVAETRGTKAWFVEVEAEF
jgi:hypothetical protein